MLNSDIEPHITNEKQYPYQVHFRNHQAPFPTPYLKTIRHMLTPDIEPHITNERQHTHQVHFRNKQCKVLYIRTWGSVVLE